MKKTLLFLALCCTQFSFSQYYNLSDSNFRNWIKTRYQSINPSIIVGNGLDTSIAKTIGNLSFKLINESTITNVDGIQFFYLTSFELRNTKVKSISNKIFGPINGSRLDTFSIMNNDSLASINVQIALNNSNQLPTYRKIQNNKNLILIDTLLMTGGDFGGGGSTRIYNNVKLQKINFIDFQTIIIDTNAMLDTIKRIGNLNTTGIYIYKNSALRYIGDIKISADNTDIVSINDNKELNYLGDISGFTTIQNVANYLFGISLDKNPKLVTLKKLPLVSEICFISNMMGLTKITSLQKRIKMELKLENIPLLDSVLVNYPDTTNSISLINLGVKKISNFPTICNDITVRNCKALLSNTGIPEFPIFKNNVQVYLEDLNISSIPTLVAQTKNIRIDMMNHPNFKCLPVLMEMYNFNFDTNVIKCFPNFVSTTPSKGLPLCNGSNPNGCGIFDNISGKVFNEKNSG